MSAAYRIESDRLVIRCWQPQDAEALKEAIDSSLEQLTPWLPWAEDEPEPVAEKVERLRGFRGRFDLDEDFAYGIFDRDETRVVGASGLHSRAGDGAKEIGYWLRSGDAGHGYMTEAVCAITRVAFEVLAVSRVEIHCDPANERSAAVARRAGYRHEATLGKRLRHPPGQLHDEMIFTLFADEYPASPAAAVSCSAYDVVGGRLL